MKTTFDFDFSTEIYMHNETGSVDTKQGWIDSIDDAEEVERSIESGILADMDKETLAKLIMEKAACKDDMEIDSYRNGQVEKTIGIHSGTGLAVVELRDDMMLAYVGIISLSDLCTGSVSEDVEYRFTFVFDHDQEDYATDSNGELDASYLDWEQPYKFIVKEV